MKARIILFFSIFIPLAMIFTYIWLTATDYFYGDDTLLIKGGFIENYLNGNLTFTDLWRPKGMIRFLGYNLLLLANIKWFSMNSKIFVFLIPFLLLCSALLIYRDYRKSLTPNQSPEFISATFLLITFIIFNVIQWQGLISGYGLNFQLPMPFIIASFVSMELYLSNGWKYLPLTFILFTLAVLFFGGTPVFAFVPALGITFLCYVIIRRSLLTRDFWFRTSIIGVFLVLITFLYTFNIHQNDYAPDFSPYYSPFAGQILKHPLEAGQFLITAFSASVVGIDVFFACDYFSVQNIIFIGLIIVFLYIQALFLFFRSRMYERTYLPVFLILLTFFHLLFITIGRFGLVNRTGSMMSSYTCVSIFGLVAIVWIFIYYLSQPLKPKTVMKFIISSGFVMIFTGLLLTSVVVWHIQPTRKAYFEQLRGIALRLDKTTIEELERWDFNGQICDSLKLLRKHKLNIYRSVPTDIK